MFEVKGATIKNLTPHYVKIYRSCGVFGSDGKTIYEEICNIPPEPISARLVTRRESIGTIDGIDVDVVRFGELRGMMPASPLVYYVVSRMVAEHPDLRNRSDILIPGELCRDGRGSVLGCIGLSFVPWVRQGEENINGG